MTTSTHLITSRSFGAVLLLFVGCGGQSHDGGAGASGAGQTSSGGEAGGSSRGGTSAGGTPSSGGEPTGGSSAGGSAGSSGRSSGGTDGGGSATGGKGAGGSATGGKGAGGSATGGKGAGGSATGGKGAGGSATGGKGAGGAGAGGAPASGGASSGGGGVGGGVGGGAGSGNCPATACGLGLTCCSGKCVNPSNDILNCGACGTPCQRPSPYCNNGTCGAPYCDASTSCGAQETCCGSQCCGAGQLCCTVNRGPSVTSCTDPVDGTCPAGCPACVCAAPDTPIATPGGEHAIAELKVGDLIYSTSGFGVVVVPIREVNRVPVHDHVMVELELANGRVLRLSPGHPTFERRKVEQLHAGERLDGVLIRVIRRVPYAHPYTYDILADSASGAYFAGGVLMGSTLAVPPQIDAAAVRP